MKYYNYNEDNIIINIGRCNKVLASTLTDINKLDDTEPVILSSSSIKFFVAKLKEDKDNFKKLVYKFNKLKKHEILTLMKRYYNFSSGELRQFQLEEHAKKFPVKKTIKTSILTPTQQNLTFKRAKLTILAKKGVKFNPLKIYSKEEISKMIANDEIVVIAKESYGKAKRHLNSENCLIIETLAKEFDEKTFDEDTIKILEKKNPEALEELLGSMNLLDMHFNYELDYLPAYKKMLDYFVKCAKATVALNEETKQNLQKQINKANEQNREMEDVKKFILDTSKGR